jgi:peptidoglycan/LPS O-acetylase OafA/YrhL/O-antigen/teichoic acid export membrane protein
MTTFTAGLAVSLILSTLAACVAVVVIAPVSSNLAVLRSHGSLTVLFIVGTSLTTLSGVLDFVFIAERQSWLLVFRSFAFGATKLPILLVPAVTALVSPSVTLIIGAWVIGWGVTCVLGLRMVRRSLGKHARVHLRSVIDEVRLMTRNLVGNHFTTLGNVLPTYVLPVVVITRLSAADNAYFYMTWMIGGIFFMISGTIGSSLFADGMRNPTILRSRVMSSARFTAALALPAMLVAAAIGYPLLRIFGPAYASHGYGLLLILTICAIPDAITNLYVPVLRVRDRLLACALLTMGMASLAIIGAWIVAPSMGLLGVGLAWGVSQAVGSGWVAFDVIARRRRRPVPGPAVAESSTSAPETSDPDLVSEDGLRSLSVRAPLPSTVPDEVPALRIVARSAASSGATPPRPPTPASRGHPPRHAPRLPVLDGLRALAILDVVAFHVGVLPGGGIGVTIFFVLSGYLITGILCKPGTLNRQGLRTFYLRRFFRLFPALLVVSMFVLVFTLLVLHGHVRHLDLVEVPASLSYVQDFYLGHGASTPDFGYLGHTWSLAVEEQFYLLWPLLLMVILRVARTVPRRVAFLAVCIVAIAGWRAHLAGLGLNAHVGLNIDCQADSLLVGCTLALVLPRIVSWLPRHQRLLDGLGLVSLLVVLAFSLRDLNIQTPGRIGYLIVSVSTALLMTRLLIPTSGRIGGSIRRVFAWRPAVIIGLASYSLYLWHPVILAIAKRNLGIDTLRREVLAGPAIVLAIVAVTWISYRFVEQPGNRLKERLFPESGPGRITLAVDSPTQDVPAETSAIIPL